MELDEEDFIFYGTPIEREEDTSTRKRKAVADAGSLRSLPAWKQEVRDDEGRKRFHGAFKGGYSAGYYNTVGSKEGWSPQTFASSRKNRADVKKQNIYNFLDEEDIKDMGGQALETSLKFDTFGFTAAELARKQAENEQKNRTSAIPGPIPNEIIVPASNSVGVKLLLKMGWRRGHSIKETQANSLYDARREARKALLAFTGNVDGEKLSQNEFNQWDTRDQTEWYNDDLHPFQSTPAYAINPKKDLYGLGFDPFKHAPEFKERKMLHELRNNNLVAKRDILMKGNFLAPNSGKYASGFGIGALEELDIEDEDIYASGFELIGTEVQEDEPSRTIVDDKIRLDKTKKGFLPGFKVASGSDYNIERFHPPVIPPDFKPHHKFASPLETMNKFLDSPPPEVPPPDDDNLRVLIDGFAKLVARCGKLFEDLSKVKNRSNPLFSFLTGGNGHNYYARKLWEANQKHADLEKQAGVESVSSGQRMTAGTRGKVLGERPLDRSSNDPFKSAYVNEVVQFQTNLSDTFTKPAALVNTSDYAKSFMEDPAKQERFEIFLKEKYQGGLSSSSYGITGKMSETERALEKLDFESAAEALMKGEWKVKGGIPTNQHSIDLSRNIDERFVSSVGAPIHRSSQDEEKLTDKILPKREEFQWRPSALLCKRFDIVDPFIGKPPPAPRPRGKMDTLIFLTDSVMGAKDKRIEVASKESSSRAGSKDLLATPQLEDQNAMKSTEAEQYDADLSTTLQRPVDLYKAIFSDESDYEDDTSFNSVVEPQRRSEGANTTLNRLIAGDFLESLGKELGLEVPVEPSFLDKVNSTSSTLSSNTKSAPAIETSNAAIENKNVIIHESRTLGITDLASKAHQSNDMKSGYIEEGRHNDSSPWRENMFIGTSVGQADVISFGREEKEVIKKKEQHRKHRSSRHQLSSSDTDSSSGHEYYNRSRSEKKASSKKKHRKHERQHNRKNSRSHNRYSSDTSDSEHSDDDRRDRSSRDRRRHSGRSKADVGRKYL